MKYISNKFKWAVFSIIATLVLFAGCQKDNDLGQPDRLFRPIVTETEYAGTWIRYVWDMYDGVDYYELQLAADDTTNIVATAETDTSFYTFEGLNYDTEYYLLLKSHGDGIESDFFVAEMILTNDFPTKLTSVNTTSSAAKVNWEDAAYSSLELSLNDTVRTVYDVTTEDNAQKYAILEGLLADTTYIVRAYDNSGAYQGKLSFTTGSPESFRSSNVIDLRSLTDEEAYGAINQDLFDQAAALRAANDSLVTIVLKGGTHYEFPGTTPGVGFIMKTGESLEGNAVLEVTGNFDFEAELDTVELNGLTFSFPPGNAESNYGGKYVVNGSKGGSIDYFAFYNCEISHLRGVIRTKDSGLFMKNITFSNCVIDSINGYGVLNIGVNYSVESIKVTNTTISNTATTFRLDGVKIDETDGLTGVSLLQVENSNFIYADVLFRCGDIAQVTFLKNIFAGSNSGANDDGIYSPSYQLRGNFGATRMQDNYTTADTNISDFDNTQMRETMDEVFVDPVKKDFTLTVSQYRNFIGDPRWW